MAFSCRVSIDWKYSSAALPPGVMTDMPFQLDAPGIYKVQPCSKSPFFWSSSGVRKLIVGKS